jgi:serine/threonine protein phosphatase 1
VALLGAADWRPGEVELIALGDLVDRGPEPQRVLDFVRAHAVRCLMGNHERKHLLGRQGRFMLAQSQLITRAELGPERYADACALMATFPTAIELDHAILVHGYFDPALPLGEQDDGTLLGMLGGAQQLRRKYGQPWYELYRGPKPIVVGHHHYRGNGQPLVVPGLVYGLDTGCCHGYRLTALMLPELRLVSVRSRADYWSQARLRYPQLKTSSPPARRPASAATNA